MTLTQENIEIAPLGYGAAVPCVTPDGVTRLFHQSGGRLRQGYVYVGKARIYGLTQLVEQTRTFTPNTSSRHKHLVGA